MMSFKIALLVGALLMPASLSAQVVADMAPRDGFAVHVTSHDYDTLVERTRAAIAENGLAVVTQAGPTAAAASRGVAIPGNTVIGAFNNIFAVRILEMSTAAMIEAPLPLYITENADGTATLSYALPSRVFAAYEDEGGAALAEVAAELDVTFAAIAADATAR